MAKRKPRAKKITVSEFQLWITGVESMQEDDWSPTPSQWKMIREQIDNIKETEVVKETAQAAPPPQMVPQYHQQHHQPNHHQQRPRELPAVQSSGQLPMPSLIPPPNDPLPPMPTDASSVIPGENGIRVPKIDANAEGPIKPSFT